MHDVSSRSSLSWDPNRTGMYRVSYVLSDAMKYRTRRWNDTGVSIWRYGAENSASKNFLAPKAVFAAPDNAASRIL